MKSPLLKVWGINTATTGTNKKLLYMHNKSLSNNKVDYALKCSLPSSDGAASDLPASGWVMPGTVVLSLMHCSWCATISRNKRAQGMVEWSHACVRIATVMLLPICGVILCRAGSWGNWLLLFRPCVLWNTVWECFWSGLGWEGIQLSDGEPPLAP